MTKSTSKSKQRSTQVIRTLPALNRLLAPWTKRRHRLALVPTMGALHAGHLALVRLAQRRADRVVVSIFINPAQFSALEDFGTYPRSFAADVAALAALDVNAVWAPSAETMYPVGFATRIASEGPATAGLEDAFRPHFFAGVATVVAKLLIQCKPDFALFGEKDYQQLKVVTQLVRDFGLNTRIVGAPTVREPDGLALSSRNAYLSPRERAAAPTLFRVLAACARRIVAGAAIDGVLGEGRAAIARAGFVLDYLEARHAETLAPIASRNDGPVRLLGAARIGKTRLIDNVAA
jgi:pantoate--beta-alanine ligase